MKKRSANKRVITAAVLFGMFVIGAIISIVMVLAATTQNVKTRISIEYNVSGVGVNVGLRYAMIPLNKNNQINVKNGKGINFGVFDSVNDSVEKIEDENLNFDSEYQQVVFEYHFTSSVEIPFYIELINTPIKESLIPMF